MFIENVCCKNAHNSACINFGILTETVSISGSLFTFDLLIFFIPASKLLAFDGGYVGIVGAIYNGGNHTLKKEKKKKKLRSQKTLDDGLFSM